VPEVAEPGFRFVSTASSLSGTPGGWARDMLREGEIALVADAGGLEAIDAVAHALGVVTIPVVRGEASAEAREQSVMSHAAALPLVWVAPAFSDGARAWARERGPMTLLIESGAPLSEDEQHRIERFVATLGRQSE